MIHVNFAPARRAGEDEKEYTLENYKGVSTKWQNMPE